jgi:hypothetical protein
MACEVVEHGQDGVARRGGKAQHRLADADLRVVVELPALGQDASNARRSEGSASRTPAPPIGIQPSAYSATCANRRSPAAPPISTGGRGCWSGFGHIQEGSKRTNSPW